MTTDTTTTTPTTIGTTYFEISGPDADGLRRFYGDALGLELSDPQDGYTMIGAPDGEAIQGGIWDGSAGPGTYAVFYIRVADVDAAVERAVAAGATVLAAPFDHGPTRSAHVADPAGNRIGLYHQVGDPGTA